MKRLFITCLLASPALVATGCPMYADTGCESELDCGPGYACHFPSGACVLERRGDGVTRCHDDDDCDAGDVCDRYGRCVADGTGGEDGSAGGGGGAPAGGAGASDRAGAGGDRAGAGGDSASEGGDAGAQNIGGNAGVAGESATAGAPSAAGGEGGFAGQNHAGAGG